MVFKTTNNQSIHISEQATYSSYFTFFIKVISNCGLMTESRRESFTYGEYDNVEDYLNCNYRLK